MASINSDMPTLPTARGPLSAKLILVLGDQATASDFDDLCTLAGNVAPENVLTDDDVQLTLFLLYLLHYGPFNGVDPAWEWNPRLIECRVVLESVFEQQLRAKITVPDPLPTTGEEVAKVLFNMTAPASHPELAKWVAKHATDDQMREFLMHRSIYTLREADPHSWAIPRLRGRAKAALVEIQSDEYGAGRPDRVHAEIYARTMRAFGLDDTPDAYLDQIPATTLASTNTMSMFGLQRRLRGAIVGHLAAFEMTSSIPNGFYSRAFTRLGYGTAVTDYFDEHVEADAVHEQIAGRDLAGGLAESEPTLIADILFGAAACLQIDDDMGQHMFESWSAGRTSLRDGSNGV